MYIVKVSNKFTNKIFEATFESEIDKNKWLKTKQDENAFGKNERWLFEEEFTTEKLSDSIDSMDVVVSKSSVIYIYAVNEDGSYVINNGEKVIKDKIIIPELIKTKYKFPKEYSIVEIEINGKYKDKDHAFADLRKKRNMLLKKTDCTQLSDYPIDSEEKRMYREYRSYLRKLPSNYKDETVMNFVIKTYQEWKQLKYPK